MRKPEMGELSSLPSTYYLVRHLSSLRSSSAKYRDPLNLDQHFRTCETGNGNQRTGRKIIAKDLLS